MSVHVDFKELYLCIFKTFNNNYCVIARILSNYKIYYFDFYGDL